MYKLFNIILFYYYFFSLDLCRHLKFTTPVDGYALEGHVIKNISLSVGVRGSCRGRCTIDCKCLSINMGPPIKEHVLCQLSDSDHMLHPEDLKPREGFTYRGTEVRNHYSVDRGLLLSIVEILLFIPFLYYFC